jgi:hypothetical protein
MENQNQGPVPCEACGRPLEVSTSNANRGKLRACTFCRQERWRDKNRAKISADNKRRYEANADQFKKNAADWRAANLEKHRGVARKAKLKTRCSTPEYYDAKFAEQNGVCALCGRASLNRRLDQDHDAKRQIPRGLLCRVCNPRVGWFEAIREIIPRIEAYLAPYEKEKACFTLR